MAAAAAAVMAASRTDPVDREGVDPAASGASPVPMIVPASEALPKGSLPSPPQAGAARRLWRFGGVRNHLSFKAMRPPSSIVSSLNGNRSSAGLDTHSQLDHDIVRTTALTVGPLLAVVLIAVGAYISWTLYHYDAKDPSGKRSERDRRRRGSGLADTFLSGKGPTSRRDRPSPSRVEDARTSRVDMLPASASWWQRLRRYVLGTPDAGRGSGESIADLTETSDRRRGGASKYNAYGPSFKLAAHPHGGSDGGSGHRGSHLHPSMASHDQANRTHGSGLGSRERGPANRNELGHNSSSAPEAPPQAPVACATAGIAAAAAPRQGSPAQLPHLGRGRHRASSVPEYSAWLESVHDGGSLANAVAATGMTTPMRARKDKNPPLDAATVLNIQNGNLPASDYPDAMRVLARAGAKRGPAAIRPPAALVPPKSRPASRPTLSAGPAPATTSVIRGLAAAPADTARASQEIKIGGEGATATAAALAGATDTQVAGTTGMMVASAAQAGSHPIRTSAVGGMPDRPALRSAKTLPLITHAVGAGDVDHAILRGSTILPHLQRDLRWKLGACKVSSAAPPTTLTTSSTLPLTVSSPSVDGPRRCSPPHAGAADPVEPVRAMPCRWMDPAAHAGAAGPASAAVATAAPATVSASPARTQTSPARRLPAPPASPGLMPIPERSGPGSASTTPHRSHRAARGPLSRAGLLSPDGRRAGAGSSSPAPGSRSSPRAPRQSVLDSDSYQIW
ncbi:hypothetical protein CXG81DRAFT_18273 [Caulochytrium protostelioides]|uniref:Uncharacterized protein n=1 Tax=Caulochytrium protostelioides TaxID=1555241 RepID=A0A4P9WZW7_9FUNG|nr:hypothetical protein CAUPRSCDRAFT_10211 [Caulochytrium protostelioides]RKP01980.1 hypothetical protein CXG81DRAFT_18273 [Caulochytrium protostelioides]|eukprot:RKP01980.1 hypothetical protein CXG81DRAFT_18273 [Caulochytrium protostelioides]